MNPIWEVSIILQWLLIVGLSVVVLALVRQLGVLTVRLNPSAALETLAGQELLLGGSPAQAPTVVVFVAPGCKPCDSLVPAFQKIARDYALSAVRFIVAINADGPTARAYAEQHRLDGLDVLAAGRLANELGTSSTPYGIAVDSNGIVAKRAIVNALEHLEQMLVVAELGVSRDGQNDSRDGNGARATTEPAPLESEEAPRKVIEVLESGGGR
jgi:methylamine dehydrogenase accessory protein MauD